MLHPALSDVCARMDTRGRHQRLLRPHEPRVASQQYPNGQGDTAKMAQMRVRIQWRTFPHGRGYATRRHHFADPRKHGS